MAAQKPIMTTGAPQPVGGKRPGGTTRPTSTGSGTQNQKTRQQSKARMDRGGGTRMAQPKKENELFDEERKLQEKLAAEQAARAAQPDVQVDTAQQDQFRAQQMELAKMLAQRASGQGPSMSAQMMKQAQDRNLAAQLAAQASQRGGSGALGGAQLAQQAGQAGQQLAGQATLAQMQEQQAAQQQLAALSGQGRQQDIGLAGMQTQSGIQQQAMRDQFNMGILGQLGGSTGRMTGGAVGLEQARLGNQAAMDRAYMQTEAQKNMATQQQKNAILGGILGAGGSVLGGMATGGTGIFG